MPYSIYESIRNDQSSLVNAFVARIESSTFHWHNEYEMIGILQGEVTVRYGYDMIKMAFGDLLLINPNVIHSIESLEGKENLCMFVQIRPDLFELDKDNTSNLRFYLDSVNGEKPKCGYQSFFLRMVKIVYETLSEDKYAPFRVRAQACCLIADMFDNVVYDIHFRDNRTKSYQEMVVAIIEFVENHLEEEKIVEITCHDFGLSRKTLDRNLKMTIGLTAKEIIDNLRMAKAKDLLKNTNKNMNYILDSCGFGSEKTFYRMFRQETGLTPKEFRQKGQLANNKNILKGYLDYEMTEVRALLNEILVSRKEKE